MYALTLVAATVLGSVSPEAYALALGRITVQSALGEPLRAEIDVPEITAAEAASLKATVAPPDAFRAAGLEYNPAMSGLVLEMQQIAGGRTVLRVSSSRAINDPFVDLILEVTWSSGRIVRDYTMLFDPPSLRPATPPPSVAVLPPVAPREVTARPLPPPPPAPATAPALASTPAPVARPSPAPSAPVAKAPAPTPSPAAGSRQVTVKTGDTAGRIAATHKPASVSLDQMLLALLQANPNSFIDGNVNLVKAGAVLDIPSADQASLIEPSEASRTLIAQSRDFNEFRRKLAEGVPSTQVEAAARQATGKVQAKVEDKKPTATAPDKLTLSKGSVQAKAAADKIAKDRQAQEAAARVAELNKNIAELSKLGAASSAAPKAPAATSPAPAPVAATAPAVATPTVAPTVVAAVKPAEAPPPAVAASAHVAATPAPAAEAPAPAPAVAASPAPVVAPTPKASAPKPAAAPAPAAEPGVLEQLMENPLIPAGAVAMLALLLGLGVYQSKRRKSAAQVDSSFLESRLQPDSFFGASGGQHIDTNEGSPTGSSMVYSPSQLDAAGDVDPVAEADVYLAYGRDLQAEEILKEALRINPKRVAIHGKLLEIYAKRRDAKAFELVASDAFSLTHGSGPDWERICEQGQDLDPANPMYRPGGEPDPGAAAAAAAAKAVAPADDFSMATATHVLPTAPDAGGVDLDLDFSLDGPDESSDIPAVDMQATTPMQVEPTVSFNLDPEPPPSPAPAAMDMDFGMATVPFTAIPEPAAPQPASEETVRLSAPDLTLSENDLSFSAESFDLPAAEPPPPAPKPARPPVVALDVPAPPPDAGMIEFDLGALSLDLDLPAPPAAKAAAQSDDTAGSPLSTGFDDSGADPLATKLALAEEFSAIGDPDGARSLAEEVLAEASGPLKERAKRFIAELA